MFAQAGKLGIPGIVFACDTEPVVVTRSPHDWVTLRPRRIEFDNVERLRTIDFCRVVASAAELEAANRQNLPIIWKLLNAVADDANVLGMEKEALIEDFMIAYGEALGNIGFNNRDIMRMSAQGLAA